MRSGLLRASFLALVAAAAAATAAAEPMSALFPPDALAQLEASGVARRTFHDGQGPTLFPALPIREEARARIADLEPTVGVEMLVSFRPPAGPPGGDPRTIYNALHSISSLKGIEYYSVSRGRTHTLFYDAGFVETADGQRRLPDPTLAVAPADGLVERRHAAFDDASFGRYVVNVSYELRAGSSILSFENASAIRKMLIPFVQPGALLSMIIVLQQDDGIVVYGFSCVRAPNLFGMVQKKGEDSFANRLAALMSWFRAAYETAYGR